MNAIIHSFVPPDPWLVASSLALQAKFDRSGKPNGVRPTATREPITTLIARVVMIALSSQMKEAIFSNQYGLASNGALKSVVDTMCKLGSDP